MRQKFLNKPALYDKRKNALRIAHLHLDQMTLNSESTSDDQKHLSFLRNQLIFHPELYSI